MNCSLRQHISSILHCANNVHSRVPIQCLRYSANDGAHAIHGKGGGGRGHVGGNLFVRVCARNYSGAQFIAPMVLQWKKVQLPQYD